jgi:hypothetical protein
MEQNQITQPNQYHPQVDKNTVLSFLVKEVEKLKKQISDIKNEKLIDSLQLTEEQTESSTVLTIPHRLKTANGWRPLLESEILDAQVSTESATEAAKYLGIDYRTYKKWCLVYNKWKINPWGKGSKKKYWDPNKGKYPLNQILEGKFPNYPVYRLKDLLIRSNVKKAECEVCGWDERRVDGKLPLLLNFKDGDEQNHLLENLQILCYCHYFIMGRGYIRHGKVEFNFKDPDRLQGSSRKIDIRF